MKKTWKEMTTEERNAQIEIWKKEEREKQKYGVSYPYAVSDEPIIRFFRDENKSAKEDRCFDLFRDD